MTYIARYVFKGDAELPPEVPSPTAEEWDEFMDGLEHEDQPPTEKELEDFEHLWFVDPAVEEEWDKFMNLILGEVDREGSWQDYLHRHDDDKPLDIQ